jgi:surfeit locus 1 family protein
MLSLRIKIFLFVAIVVAVACVRLGFWQLDRRQQRLVVNASVAAQAALPALDVGEAARTGAQQFRRITVTGVPDYEREMLLVARSHRGSPGAYLITPVRRPDSDTAVIVLRGWVYAPDGMTVDKPRWHEGDTTTTFEAYIQPFVTDDRSGALADRPGALRRMEVTGIAGQLPYPVLPFYVIAQGDTATTVRGESFVRLAMPSLDDQGPHLSYAVQWFGFALVALVGAGIVAARSMQSG